MERKVLSTIELPLGCTFLYGGLKFKVVLDDDEMCGCDRCFMNEVFPAFCYSQKCAATHREDKTNIHYETVNE